MANAMPEIIVRGREELAAAMLEMRREVLKEIKPALLAAAKPIADDAHGKTLRDIPTITDRWSQFRIGATMTKNIQGVYVAPKARRRRGGSPRPNLAPMLAREMEAAVERNKESVYLALDSVVEVSAARNGLRMR